MLHADVRPPWLTRPGRIVGRDSEYERRGTVDVFSEAQSKAGRLLANTRSSAMEEVTSYGQRPRYAHSLTKPETLQLSLDERTGTGQHTYEWEEE